MCDGAVDDSLATLKLIPDQFLTSKMIKKNFIALYANENMLYVNEDSGTVVFNCNGMLIKMIFLLLILSDFCLGILNLKKAKHLKKS